MIKALALISSAAALLWVALPYRGMAGRILSGQNDFLQVYAGAELCCSVRMYSFEANRALQEIIAGQSFAGISFTRLPFYAALASPLTALDYQGAYFAFQILSLAALAVSLTLIARFDPNIPWFAAVSVPVLLTFINGQDTAFLLLVFTAALWTWEQGWPILAGLTLSLGAIKPHLFLCVPLAIAASRQWRLLAGLAAGGATLAAFSFVLSGPGWPAAWWQAASSAEMNLLADHMISFRTILNNFSADTTAAAVAGAVAALAVTAWYALRSDLPSAIALAVIAGLAFSWHAYHQDAVLLLFSAPLLARGASRTLRAALLAAMLSPAYALTNLAAPWNVTAAVLLLTVISLAVLEAHERSNRTLARHTAA